MEDKVSDISITVSDIFRKVRNLRLKDIYVGDNSATLSDVERAKINARVEAYDNVMALIHHKYEHLLEPGCSPELKPQVERRMTQEEQHHEQLLWAIANASRFEVDTNGTVAVKVSNSKDGKHDWVCGETVTETVREAIKWHKDNPSWD